MFNESYPLELLEKQIKINGKYSTMAEKALAKRSISTAVEILQDVRGFSFETLELAIYLKSENKEVQYLINKYGFMLEEAKLNEENFINSIHEFYLKMGKHILQNDPRDFLDLYYICLEKIRNKRQNKVLDVFNAYISLLINQFLYLAYLQGRVESYVCGCDTNGELMYAKDPFPYSDYPSFELEREMLDMYKKQRNVNSLIPKIRKTYKKYGYIIESLDDIEHMEAISRSYGNNILDMSKFINEYTEDMIPTKPAKMNYIIKMPRIWKETEFYKEKLQKRKFTLAAEGVIGTYENIPLIKTIKFREIYSDDHIVLLYKIETQNDEEFSGFYNTKTEYFFSIFENTSHEHLHEELENFILENYCMLTCDLEIDRKRNQAIKIRNTKEEKIYPYQLQPVVYFTYKKLNKKTSKTEIRHYDRSIYKSEKAYVSPYIRKLPDGYKASESAKQLALQLGYGLDDGYTIVKPFEKHVLRIQKV